MVPGSCSVVFRFFPLVFFGSSSEESAKLITKIHIPRLRGLGIGLISRKKSRPDLLVQRLCKVKGCNDPHLTLLIFSSCRQPKNVLLTLINNSLPERPDTDLTFSPLAFICSGMAFLTFALFRQNLDLISNNLLKTAVYLSSMPAVFFPLFTLPFCLEKEAAVCSVP